jgi:hypothetical protein
MSKILTPLARRATAAIVATLIAAPAFAEARLQPLVVAFEKPVTTAALLNRDTVRPAPKDTLAMNLVAACTRTGTRMVC